MSDNILDNQEVYRRLDTHGVLTSIKKFVDQIKQAFTESSTINIPDNYKNVNDVVICGMGGSRFGGRIAAALFNNTSKVPLIVMGDYRLPAFVNEESLVFLSSYSGNTEEILSAAQEAISKKSKVIVFAKAGKLADLAKSNNWPGYYPFEEKHNPSGQPRLGMGYQVSATINILAKLGLGEVGDRDINDALGLLRERDEVFSSETKTEENLAKELALSFQNKLPILIGAEFIIPCLCIFQHQINENGKQLAYYFDIPELNHHLLEGLGFPLFNTNNLCFFFADSDFLGGRNRERISVTKNVIIRRELKMESFLLSATSRLGQIFELLQLGAYVSYYLAMLNGVDPYPIPWVDFFKTELEKFQEKPADEKI